MNVAFARDTMAIDPVLLSIIPNRLEAIAEEMALTLMMTSRSGIFAEARDFVTGICDAEGRLVAQSRYFPGFACALPYVVPPVLQRFGTDLADGDIVIVNDPYLGNSHLPDMNVLKPVFHDGRLAFWAIAKGHMADVGGAGVAGYDPNGETVWDEGVVVPPTRLYRRNVLQQETLDLILSQIKLPEIVRGDIMCEVGGVNIGERGLKALLAKYGPAVVRSHIEAFLNASERAMRERIRAIPPGVYLGEKAIDDDVASDRPLTVRVKITVGDGTVDFDFSASDAQSPRYMNSTDAFTRSMATLTLFATLEHSQSNHGSLRPVSFINPVGRCTNAAFASSTALATCTLAECTQEAVQLALAAAVPDKVAAPSAKLIFPMVAYIHPDKQRLDVNVDFFFRCNPSGGTQGFDGWEQGGPAQEMGMGRCPDPEIHELSHPVRILRFEQEIDSAGAGEFRGGNGHVYRVQHLVPSVKAVVFGSGTRTHAAPSGLLGGHAPAPSTLSIEHADGSRQPIPVNSFFRVEANDIIELREMGAAGFGDPRARDPEHVARDVRDGYVSVAQAASVYRCAVGASGIVDRDATRRLRERPTSAGAGEALSAAAPGTEDNDPAAHARTWEHGAGGWPLLQRLLGSGVLMKWDQAVVPLVFAAMVAIFYVIEPKYLSSTNILNVLNQVSILAIVTIGASVVIFTGGFDLSAGSVVAMSSVVGAIIVDQTGSVPLALLGGIATGLLIGTGNGLVIGYLGVSPLIVTLGSLNIARGLALIVSAGTAIYAFPPAYTDFGTSRILGLPTLALIAFGAFLLVAFVLRHTPFGMYLYAVGGNPKAAALSGINVPLIRATAFAISGATCGLAGMMLSARTGGGEPTAGFLYELEAIAAVILGGAALQGGEGRLWRSMMGIVLLAALGNGLNIVGVHPHWKGVAIGAILVLAASLDFARRRRAK